MGTLFFLVFIGAIAAFVVLKKGEAMRFETQASAGQVIMAATAQVGTARRWAVAHQTDKSVTFNYVKKPSKIIALVGLLFFFVPGVVYLVLAGKKETLSLQLDDSTGNTIVQATSNGFRGKFAARGIRQQVGVASGTTAAAQRPTVAQQVPPLPQQQLPQQQTAQLPTPDIDRV